MITFADWLARPSPKHDAADIEAVCPLCGEPAAVNFILTEDGPEWQGSCVDCRTAWEIMQ